MSMMSAGHGRRETDLLMAKRLAAIWIGSRRETRPRQAPRFCLEDFHEHQHDRSRNVARRRSQVPSRELAGEARWLALFVGVPTLVAAIYYGLIASPIYVSQSSFVIKSPGQKSAPSLSLANLVQTSGLSGGQEQTKEVVQYIQSRNALKDLRASEDIRANYSTRGADFLSRFPRRSTMTLSRASTAITPRWSESEIDPESGLAVLQVEAFTPEDADKLNIACSTSAKNWSTA